MQSRSKAQLWYRQGNQQVFWGYDTAQTGGVLGVRINGAAAVLGSTMSADTNWTGTVTATVPTTSYTWQLEIGGVAVGRVYTAPALPTDQTKVVVWGCAKTENIGFDRMREENADLAICLGDWAYIDTTAAGSGYSLASFRSLYRTHFGYSKRMRFLAQQPQLTCWDNHEVTGVTDLHQPPDSEWLNAYNAAQEAFMGGNPINTDPGVHEGIPRLPYYRATYGGIDFICMDQISWCSGRSMGNDFLGNTQRDWAIWAIGQSTSDVLVICSPNVLHQSASWASVLQALDALDKTVFVVTGGNHHASVVQRFGGDSATYVPTRDLLEIQAGPLNHQLSFNDDILNIGGNTTKYFSDTTAPTTEPTPYGANNNYLVVTYSPNGGEYNESPHVLLEIKSIWGWCRWRGTMAIGSRTVQPWEPRKPGIMRV